MISILRASFLLIAPLTSRPTEPVFAMDTEIEGCLFDCAVTAGTIDTALPMMTIMHRDTLFKSGWSGYRWHFCKLLPINSHPNGDTVPIPGSKNIVNGWPSDRTIRGMMIITAHPTLSAGFTNEFATIDSGWIKPKREIGVALLMTAAELVASTIGRIT